MLKEVILLQTILYVSLGIYEILHHEINERRRDHFHIPGTKPFGDMSLSIAIVFHIDLSYQANLRKLTVVDVNSVKVGHSLFQQGKQRFMIVPADRLHSPVDIEIKQMLHLPFLLFPDDRTTIHLLQCIRIEKHINDNIHQFKNRQFKAF